MKKFLPIALVLVVLIGAGLYIRSKQGAVVIPEKAGEGSLLPDVVSEAGEKVGVVSSIKDAIGLGKKMKCTYITSDGSGGQSSSSIIVDGKKYEFSAEVNGQTSYGIFDGETQYIWSGNTKQGLKITKACIDELTKSIPQNGDNNSSTAPKDPQDFENSFGNGASAKCEPTSEDLSVPTDINFIDQCELMRSTTKAMEGVKDKLPAGVTIPGL